MTKPKFDPETPYTLSGADLNKLWGTLHTLYCDGLLPYRVRDRAIVCCHTLERAEPLTL